MHEYHRVVLHERPVEVFRTRLSVRDHRPKAEGGGGNHRARHVAVLLTRSCASVAYPVYELVLLNDAHAVVVNKEDFEGHFCTEGGKCRIAASVQSVVVARVASWAPGCYDELLVIIPLERALGVSGPDEMR